MLVFSRYFIDGTVASVYVSGDPTKSLEQYKFDSSARDITYYGTGCDNQWDQEKADEGYGGSDIPCSTRIVANADGEDQKNGTYYHYQAATSGSGSVQTADNINIPDTFCPLGWQLPYSGTGGDYYDKSRSWNYLFSTYNITSSKSGSNSVRSYPFDYVYSGLYFAHFGKLYLANNIGSAWSKTTATPKTDYTGFRFTVDGSSFKQTKVYKNEGHPVRCIDCLNIPFIDGTVAGTDMLQSKDGQQLHDHTFIGNGCPNEWVNDPPSYGGSGTSCTTKIVKDGNDEDQSIGVLYTFQAATSGSGGTIKTDNVVSPDTFCPLGWQVPYGGTGGDYYDKSKSWYYLFTEYSIPFNDGNASSAQKVKSYPFSYIFSGHFNLTNGYLYNQSISGLYFSTTARGDYDAYRYVILPGKVRTLEISNKAYALAVRCASSVHRRHGGRNTCRFKSI